jgi:hypothetical protein
MIDWLNTKAALSISTVMLIALAGSWYAYQSEQLQENQFEVLLDKFVSIINRVSASPTSIFINLTFNDNSREGSGYYFKQTFNNKPYQIILTETFVIFQQDQMKYSQEFISRVLLIRSFDQLKINQCIESGMLISETDLPAVSIIRSNSSTDLVIVKMMLDSNGIIVPQVIISPYSVS